MELRKSVTKTIDGFTYEITQLGAIKGSQVFVRLVKLFGPALATKNAQAFFDNLNEDDVKYFCDVFGPLTFVAGVGTLDKAFDFHFVGRYGAMVQWLLACIEVNFGDFLKGKSLGAAAQALGQGASQSTSQPAATGPSGAS